MPADIVPLASLGDPTRLQVVAESIFGHGDRVPGWFARKLARECVDPRLSYVAIDGAADDPSAPEAWLGYVLVGAPASRSPHARTAGTGVVTRARGQGLARALHQACAQTCRDAGYEAIELWAEHGREAMYERLGFTVLSHHVTLLAFGRGSDTAVFPPPLAWDPADPSMCEVQGYLAEAWSGSDHGLRSSWILGDGRSLAHVTREGRALTIHRLLTRDPDHTLADLAQLRCRVPAATPVLLVGLDRASPVATQLDEQGWQIVQRSSNMLRRLV